jgi:poly(beta-D-mannuronate) lyase
LQASHSLAIGAVAVLAHAGGAGAATFYVSNPASISAAAAQPGDTIVMLTNGVWNDASISFKKAGTPANPITLKAQVPGKVLLTGNSHLYIGGTNLVVDGLVFTNGSSTQTSDIIAFRTSTSSLAKNCRLTNTSMIELNPSVDTNGYKWVSLYGTSNRVDHCLFRGKRNEGATLTVWLATNNIPNDHLIDHNLFDDRTYSGSNGGESMRIGDSSTSIYTSHTIVESNYFNRCSGDVEIISSKSCDNIYRYNTFVNSQGCLTFRHGRRCAAIGNFFFGNGNPNTGGIRVIDEDHVVINNYFQDLRGREARAALSLETGIPNSALSGYFQVKNAIVAFNSFVNCHTNIIISVDYGDGSSTNVQTLSPRDCLFANNVIKGINNNLVYQNGFPTNIIWQANICFGGNLGITQPPGITITNPLLVLAGDGLYRPASNSPAIDAASVLTTNITDDMDGQPRVDPKDIGADELSAAPVTRGPVKLSDVGPIDPDTDGDGMPDGWETANGLNPNDPADATQDPDGDGLSNLQEFQAGTDPNDPGSALRIISVVPENNDVRVTWQTGLGRTNALEAGAGLAGEYGPEAFTTLFTVTNTTGTTTNYIDVGAATNIPARYYRVRLVP